jgi:hypothetical protein
MRFGAAIAAILVGTVAISVLNFVHSQPVVPKDVQTARLRNATLLTEKLRAVFHEPARASRLELRVDSDGTIFLPLSDGPDFVSVSQRMPTIVVNANGYTNIVDADGDGSYDSCYDCSTVEEPAQIQETYENGISAGLAKLNSR